MAVPPQVLVALGLGGCSPDSAGSAESPEPTEPEALQRDGFVDTAAPLPTAETGAQVCLSPPIDTGTGPCLSVQACLCTCENGVETGGWMIPALGLLALARRKRSDIVGDLADRGELAPDVLERIRGTDPEG